MGDVPSIVGSMEEGMKMRLGGDERAAWRMKRSINEEEERKAEMYVG